MSKEDAKMFIIYLEKLIQTRIDKAFDPYSACVLNQIRNECKEELEKLLTKNLP